MPATILKTRDGILDASDAPALAALQSRLAQGNKTILLHLHGGLVSEEAGMDAAKRLSGQTAQSYRAPDEIEQIYVIWRTSVGETIATNWKDMFENDRLYRILFNRILKFAARRLGIPGVGPSLLKADFGLSSEEIEARLASDSPAPFADLDALAQNAEGVVRADALAVDEAMVDAELTAMLETDPELQEVAASIAAAARGVPKGHALAMAGDPVAGYDMLIRLDNAIEAELRSAALAEESKGLLAAPSVMITLVRHAAKIGWRVIKRFRSGRDHGFHATVVEELVRELYIDLIGSGIWDMMKRDAADHFKRGNLGSALIEALSGSGHRLILVGHSAGAIWVSEFLDSAKLRGAVPPAEVHFLAPAVRATKFADTLARASKQIASFRIFTMQDRFEREDPVLATILGSGAGAIYPSSLLYLISGILENRNAAAYPDAPLVGMERFFKGNTGWIGEPEERKALDDIRAMLAVQPDPLVLSVVKGGPGLSSSAIAHGGFTRDPDTLASINHTF